MKFSTILLFLLALFGASLCYSQNLQTVSYLKGDQLLTETLTPTETESIPAFDLVSIQPAEKEMPSKASEIETGAVVYLSEAGKAKAEPGFRTKDNAPTYYIWKDSGDKIHRLEIEVLDFIPLE